ncbi:protein of unknown function [Azospirillum lipoferum 4B]|uniref:Uncharacterized protein n=1 Tax=Azospirillum lipoferum (strain 4B) TaxID=862719 RepID=G7Z358_AZOL4|nr:protein of unknown function [Azospirillum lipoferum 4B]
MVGDHHQARVLELRLQSRDRRFFLCTIHGSPPCTEVYMDPLPLRAGGPANLSQKFKPFLIRWPALTGSGMVNGFNSCLRR